MRTRKPLVMVASILTALTLCVALGLGLGGCEDTDEAVTSESTAGSMASSVEDSATTTNVADGTKGIDSELLSKTKTVADVYGEIPEGKFLVTAEESSAYEDGTYIVVDPATVDPALQAQFQETASGLPAESDFCILWLGDKNRGDELNAAATNRLFIPELPDEEEGFKRNFVGPLPSRIPAEMEHCYEYGDLFAELGVETNLPALANGVFVSLIPVANPEEPDTLDHYMELYAPLLEETFYARICLDDFGPIFGDYLSTRAEVLDLQSCEQPRPPLGFYPNDFWLSTRLFIENGHLSDILQPGDWVLLSLNLDKDLAEPFVDSRGVQYISRLTLQRFQEEAFQEVRDFIYPMEAVYEEYGKPPDAEY